MSAQIINAASGEKLAIVLRANDTSSETIFFSEVQDSLQIGLIATDRIRGIPRHRHLDYDRSLKKTAEFVLIRKGACKVYLQMFEYDEPIVVSLAKGDGILLLEGIHGFESIEEDLHLLEIKQGPYAGNLDKEII